MKKMKQKAVIAASMILLLCSVAAAMTNWQPVGEGRLEIRNAEFLASAGNVSSGGGTSTGKVPAVAPLKHTEVEISVRGPVAEVTVMQLFENPLNRPIEAEYVFPLPHNAAVNYTEMRIGERVVKGRIEKRAAARKTYEQARGQGKRASLLEQERPNIFTQSVANIAPGETIQVAIRYVQSLEYVDGKYLVVFPMVVGPRFVPGQSLGGHSGNGVAEDTDEVPDASRITPARSKRCGFDIAVTVDVDAGVPVQNIRSRSHRIVVNKTGESAATVELDQADRIPNKDFVLEIETAGKQPEIGMLTHHNGKSGYFMMIVQPPEEPAEELIRPREIFLVLDCSGSMGGRPIQIVKKAAKKLLSELRPDDKFNIWAFSNSATAFQAAPVFADETNVDAGKDFVRRLRAGGGTQMVAGVRAALSKPAPEEYIRIVAMFTDGYIGNESAVLAEAGRLLGPARLFAFGVGSSVNRYLMDRLAFVGRGKADYILLNDKPEDAINRFVGRLAKPVLTDVSMNWGNAKIEDIMPSYIPDVYAGSPVYLYGRYDGPKKTEIEVVGRVGARASAAKIEVDFAGPSENSSPLPSIWARERIKQFEIDKTRSANRRAIEDQITALALEYQLMSSYTSFVAVDETALEEFSGKPEFIPVSVPIPEGVSCEMPVNKTGTRVASAQRAGTAPVKKVKKARPRKNRKSFNFDLPSFGGGGPVGPYAIIVIAALAGMKLRRRKK